MKLYGMLGSPNVRRAYAVALNLQIPVELVDVRPMSPTANSPEFRSASPAGRIPAFSDGEVELSESHAIMLYLAESKPGALWPADRKQRAQVMRWLSWSLAHWSPAIQPIQFERVVKPMLGRGEPDQAVIERTLPMFHRDAKLLDQHLNGRSWLVGEGVTLADFSVASALTYAVPAQLPLGEYKNVAAWNERMNTVPGWRESAPQPFKV